MIGILQSDKWKKKQQQILSSWENEYECHRWQQHLMWWVGKGYETEDSRTSQESFQQKFHRGKHL